MGALNEDWLALNRHVSLLALKTIELKAECSISRPIIIEYAQTQKFYETNYLLSLLEVNIEGKNNKHGLKCAMQITRIIIS